MSLSASSMSNAPNKRAPSATKERCGNRYPCKPGRTHEWEHLYTVPWHLGTLTLECCKVCGVLTNHYLADLADGACPTCHAVVMPDGPRTRDAYMRMRARGVS